MVMRYGSRIWKLRVLQAEIKMTIRYIFYFKRSCNNSAFGLTANIAISLRLVYLYICALKVEMRIEFNIRLKRLCWFFVAEVV